MKSVTSAVPAVNRTTHQTPSAGRQTGPWSKAHRLGLLFCLALGLWLAPASAPAQADSLLTVPNDSLPTLADIQNRPKQALLWSILPGGGQVYNKRWWKVPLVYTGLLGAVAYADVNQTQFRRFTRALENRCVGQDEGCVPVEDEFSTATTSNNALLNARARADRQRQTAYFGILAVYLLQAVEAYTDAHLQEFDISDDLSLRLGPVAQPDGSAAFGLVVSF